MRISAVVEPMKYNKDKGFNDISEDNRKQNSNDNNNVSFSEILKEAKIAKEYLYWK